jgi:hypothetical protein
METIVETTNLKTKQNTDKTQLYSVEEVFNRIDNKFINFYGEYGRKMVNARRTEWNQDGIANFKML